MGSGVVEVIEKNKEEINKRATEEIEVKYILDLRDFPGDPYEDRVVHDFEICRDIRVFGHFVSDKHDVVQEIVSNTNIKNI